ncbi:DUF4347 domain-containing protein, partial [Flavobacterium sp. F372]
MKIKLLLVGILFLLFSSEVFAQSGVHLFLIDEKVENPEIIEANAKSELNVKTLRVSSKAGFAEITELIKSVIKSEKLLSVNIFSHGKKGLFELGSEIITNHNIFESKNSNFFYGLNMSIEHNGSLNIFSCESGSSDEGNQLFDSLKQLGNYSVAMSTDITGGKTNWNLELSEKESFQSVLSDNINRTYRGNLQVAVEPGYTVTTAFLGTGYVTEMTTDWTGKRLFWHIDNSGGNPTTLRNGDIAAQTFALVPGVWATTWHPFIATDIEYYNNSIFTWSNSVLSMRDLSAPGAVTLASAPAVSGNECGFAVIGDTLYFQGSGRLWSKNLTTGVVTNVMAMLDNSGLEYCQTTNKLYYLNYSNNQLCEVNLAGPSLVVKSTIPAGHNANFAVDPAGQFAYIHYGASVQKVNLTTGVITAFVAAIPSVSANSDVRVGPSTGVLGGNSLYIGGIDRIWEVKICTPSSITPNIASLPDVTGQCSVAAPTAPTATDNCGTIITGTTSTVFPITTQGTITVTWTYTSGSVTTTQTQNVIVNDVTNPIITIPSTLTSVDQQQLVLNTCMGNFTQQNLAQSFIPIQNSINGASILLTDNGAGIGNVTLSLYSTLNGTLLASGTDLGVSANEWASVSWPSISITPGATYYLVATGTNGAQCWSGNTSNPYPNGQTYANSGFGAFPSFDYVFTTTYESTGGNICGSTLTYSANLGSCATNVTTNNPIISDNCAVNNLIWTISGATVDASPVSGINNLNTHSFNTGTSTVEYTLSDNNGNTSICSYNVVITDTQVPTVITQNITVQLDATGNATITAAQVDNGSTDNCGIATMTVSPNTFTCANVGPNTVTLTVTDVNGNMSTGTATVTIQDTVLPTVITQNITVQLDATGNA